MQEKQKENLIELVNRLKKKDQKAQQIFFNSYLPGLSAICTRILSDPIRSEEIALEVMGDFILHHVTQLNIPAAAFSYLRLMAIRKARRAKEKQITECELSESQTREPAIAEQMTDSALCEVLSPKLKVCLEKLSPKSRKFVQLSFQEELNHQAIGDLVGASGQYVGRMIGKSLEFLKKCLRLEATIRRAEAQTEASR